MDIKKLLIGITVLLLCMVAFSDPIPIPHPAGSDGQIQYNNGGLFGGDSTFTFNDSTKVVSMTGAIINGTIATGLDMSGGTFATGTQNLPAQFRILSNGNRVFHNFQHPTGDTAKPDGYNTFIGLNAGNFTMGSTATEIYHGSYNNAMGSYSLRSNTTGYYNNAMGYYSLRSNTTGNQNNAIGSYSLRSNTTGYQNNAMGNASLYSNTTGYQNNAMGYYSLRSNTTGNYNNAMGNASLYYNTTGNYNNAMGSYSLRSNTTGYQNNAMGYYSLYNLLPTSKAITAFADSATSPGVKTTVTSAAHGQTDGTTVQISGTKNYNGSYSISNKTDNTFDITKVYVDNDATGWWGILSEGRRNVAIGAYSGYRQTTISDALFIDNQDRGSAALELTNSLIYGVFNANVESQSFRLNVGEFRLASGTPYQILHNSTHEDTDGGRESRLNFKGEQSGGEESTLARIEAGHDGSGDDQKGYIDFYTNDGSDGDTPTKALRIDSTQTVTGKLRSSDGVSGTLVMDDGTTEKITLVFTGGILTSRTVEATTSSALMDWTD